jgi:hypothetical protein
MPSFIGNKQVEAYEWISNRDLVDSAHLLMGGIDLDPASSVMANKYVNAKNFYTISDDGLNDQEWHGNVYLFPPNRSYFWNTKAYRWKATRGLSPTLISGHALWWQTLKRKWLTGEINQAVYFSNCPDMFLYAQDIFDHPICILRTRPILVQHFLATDEIKSRNTCVSFVVYLQPKEYTSEATENFIEIYGEKGKLLY